MSQKTNTCFFCKRDITSHSPSESLSCMKQICMMNSEVGG